MAELPGAQAEFDIDFELSTIEDWFSLPSIEEEAEREKAEDAALERTLGRMLAEIGDIAANDDEPAPTSKKRVGKKTPKRARRSKARGRNFLASSKALRAASSGATSVSIVPHPTPLSKSPSYEPTTPSHPIKAGAPKPANDDLSPMKDGRAPPSWKYAGDYEKLWGAMEAVSVAIGGVAWALTLNLSDEVIAAANSNTRGPLAYIRRRIDQALARVIPQGAPQLILSLETTDSGRLHIHAAGNFLKDQCRLVKDALSKACGKWSATARQYQIDIRPLSDAAGWVRYVSKDWSRTAKVVRGSVLFIPPALKRLGKELYKQERQKIIAA